MGACTKCGNEMKGEAKFCSSCGSGQGEAALHDVKRARVLTGAKKGPRKAVIIAVIAGLVVAGWGAYSMASRAKSMNGMVQGQANREGNKSVQYAALVAEAGEVKVQVGGLSPNKAAYYVYENNGRPVKFFVLRASDGTIRAALDACTACNHAKLGYRQEGDNMVCNNCGMAFPSTRVGKVSGGCSPIPLEKREDGTLLVFKTADLEAGAKYF